MRSQPGAGTQGRRALGWLLFAAVAALLVAAIVHLAAILVRAQDVRTNAFAKVAALGNGVRLQPFPGPSDDDRTIPFRDPAMATAFCLFDLHGGPVEVRLPVTPLDVATLSVHDRHGQAVYVLTNRAAIGGVLALSIMTPAMLAESDADDTGEGALRVALDGSEGFVMVQALAAMPSLRATAAATARKLACRAGPPA